MVFKVKQKSQADYYDLRVQQAGQLNSELFKLSRVVPESRDSAYKVGYNWPYDFLSFVEKIKIDAEVLYKPGITQATQDPAITGPAATILETPIATQLGGTVQQGPVISGPAAAILETPIATRLGAQQLKQGKRQGKKTLKRGKGIKKPLTKGGKK